MNEGTIKPTHITTTPIKTKENKWKNEIINPVKLNRNIKSFVSIMPHSLAK